MNYERAHSADGRFVAASEEHRFYKLFTPGSAEECWPWQSVIDRNGYGKIRNGKGWKMAHRVAYELAAGPIPDGYQIDHTCHNGDPHCPGGRCSHRACVNPAHLEAVPQRTNLLRGKTIPADFARRTHCAQGHELTPENTLRYKAGRECRLCANARNRLYQQRRKLRQQCPEAQQPS